MRRTINREYLSAINNRNEFRDFLVKHPKLTTVEQVITALNNSTTSVKRSQATIYRWVRHLEARHEQGKWVFGSYPDSERPLKYLKFLTGPAVTQIKPVYFPIQKGFSEKFLLDALSTKEFKKTYVCSLPGSKKGVLVFFDTSDADKEKLVNFIIARACNQNTYADDQENYSKTITQLS